MKHTTHILLPACALACAAALTACGNKEAATATKDAAEEVALVDVDVARSMAVPHELSFTANVEAENVNHIAPAMSNRIKSITVDVGDRVSRGQKLVTLDATSADQQRINIDQAQRDYDRAVQLLNIGAGTQSNVDHLGSQLEALKAQYRNTMQNTVLTSPISGVVIARNYDPGDMISGQPVLTVGQITPNVKVMINVNEADLTRVTKGMPVDVTLDAFEGQTFKGRITRVAPSVDPASRTFAAEVTLPNPGGKVLPGMFGRVTVSLGDRQSVVVPDRAIDKQPGSNNRYVYVYSGGKVAYKKVELGSRVDAGYELLSGINPGDTVVIAGQARLADGAPANIKKK